MPRVKQTKYRFNPIQARNAAKYFLDLSKFTFSLLVIGSLVSDKWIALKSGVWYIGVVLTVGFFTLGMYCYKTRK